MRRPLAAIALAMALTACHDEPTGLGIPEPDAIAARARFTEIGDASDAAGADRRLGESYRRLAYALAVHARVTPVRLAIDGVEEDWLAVAREVGAPVPDYTCPRGAVCDWPPLPPTVTSIIAWNRADPRRVVQVTSIGPIGRFDAPPLFYYGNGPFQSQPTLTYLDGPRGLFSATAGTQSVQVTHTDWRCAPDTTPSGRLELLIAWDAFGRCTVAGILASFEATVSPPTVFAPTGNPAGGTHTIAMRAQEVEGARTELASCGDCWLTGYPAALLPPVNLRGTTSIPATLRVTADSVVTLTLDVWNTGSAPVTIRFPDAQQLEILVTPAGGSVPAWRLGAEQAFAPGETSHVIPAGQHWLLGARWRPPAAGNYVAQAFLTSSTHYAEGLAFFPWH